MRECYNCGSQSVIWQNDFNFEDFGYEGEGIVQIYYCANCGTYYELRIPCDEQLPEAPTFCLVTTDGSHNDVIDIAMYMSDGWNKASKVLAWMPLPSPWKGEEDDTQD